MIVKNEEEWLPQCLSSVRAIVDEIVIGDTGSTDSTKVIAKEFGANLYEIAWTDDFAAARNQVLALAKSDWLLHLDADEALDTDGATLLRRVIDEDGAGADALEVTIANYCDEVRSHRWVPVEPQNPMARGSPGYIAVSLVRVFRNHRGVEYREAVHENIGESLAEKGLRVAHLPIFIHHYGLLNKGKKPGEKDYFYLRLNRKKIQQRPDDPKSWQDLGAQLIALGEFAEGEQACRKALELQPNFLDAAISLSNVLLLQNKLDDALEIVLPFTSGPHKSPHMIVALAIILARRGRFEEARNLLSALCEEFPDLVVGYFYLARIQDLLGNSETARNVLERAYELVPTLEESQKRIKAWHLREEGQQKLLQGDYSSALRKFYEALQNDPEDPVIYNGIGEVLVKLGWLEKARENLERALKLSPFYEKARKNLETLSILR